MRGFLRERVAVRLGFAALLVLALVPAACGPITEDDLQKWSQNEEGLRRIGEMMQDEEAPLFIKVKAIEVLIRNGWASRLRDVVSKYPRPGELADAAADDLMKLFKSDKPEDGQHARDGLFALIGAMSDGKKEETRKAITEWAFTDVTPEKSREEIWALVSDKINLQQVPDLGENAVKYALVMIQKRVESDTYKLRDWLEFVLSFGNPEYKAQALEAIKKGHAELFKAMETDKDVVFEPEDVILIEKFDSVPAVLYLLDLVLNPKLLPQHQYGTLVIAEKMFDTVVPDKDKPQYVDRVISPLLAKLPEIGGNSRLKQAQWVLEKVGIDGLKDIPLVVMESVDGKDKKSWKAYLSTKTYTPSRFIFGTVVDLIDPLVAKQRDDLLKEWEARWNKEHPAGASVPVVAEVKPEEKKDAGKPEEKKDAGKPEEKKDAGKPEEKTAAAAPVAAPEGKPDFASDPEFIRQLDARLDKSVTPVIEGWLKSPVKIGTLYAIAALKYLGTPKAQLVLEKLKGNKTDVGEYLGAGVTVGRAAENGLMGARLGREFAQLKVQAAKDMLLSPDEIEKVRVRMLSDLALAPAELEKTYREELKKRQERYAQQKEKLQRTLRQYQRMVRNLCFGLIKEYPPQTDKVGLEKFVEEKAQVCQVEAEKKLEKKKLDYFGFKKDDYRSAVILGILKRELERQVRIKATARAYLRATAEKSLATKSVETELGRVRVWRADDARLGPVVQKIVQVAFDQARQDFAESGGKSGLSEAQIKEYGDFIERPERYVTAALLGFQQKALYVKTDPTSGKTSYGNVVTDYARQHFARDAFFKSYPEMTEFLIDNYYEVWYVLQDIAIYGEEQTKQRWAMTDDVYTQFVALAKEIRAAADLAVQKAVADKLLLDTQSQYFKDAFPSFDEISEVVYDAVQAIAKERWEEEKKRREEEEKKKAAAAPAPAAPGTPAPTAPGTAPAAAPAAPAAAPGTAPAAPAAAPGTAPAAPAAPTAGTPPAAAPAAAPTAGTPPAAPAAPTPAPAAAPAAARPGK